MKIYPRKRISFGMYYFSSIVINIIFTSGGLDPALKIKPVVVSI